MEIRERLEALRAQIVEIADQHGATDIRIFGSVARGTSDENSDIDFLVRLKPGTTLLDQAALVRELEAMLGTKVDVVSERGLRERVRENILREAIAL